MSPWLATNAAASSRAAKTILSSVKEDDTSELASEVAPTAPTTASVVTTKLVALAVPVNASNAARLKVFIAFISTLLKRPNRQAGFSVDLDDTGWLPGNLSPERLCQLRLSLRLRNTCVGQLTTIEALQLASSAQITHSKPIGFECADYAASHRARHRHATRAVGLPEPLRW